MKEYVIICKRNFIDTLLHKKKICIIDMIKDGKSLFKEFMPKETLKKIKIKNEYENDNSQLRVILATINEEDYEQISSVARTIKNFAYRENREEFFKLFNKLNGE